MNFLSLINQAKKRGHRSFQRSRVWLLKRYVAAGTAISRVRSQHRVAIEAFVWGVAILLAGVAIRPLQAWLNEELTANAFGDLQNVILTVGGAMIGATAIVSSFVLFALQVNVERLPYGLFRRFSSDGQLLGSFGAAFAIAIAGAALSLNQDPSFAATTIVLAIAAVIGVLRLLLHAFRRSLELINPVQQLSLLRRSAATEMRTLNRRMSWMLPIIRQQDDDLVEQEPTAEKSCDELQLDQVRLQVLNANAGWERSLREAVNHAVSYARKAGERGDVEVSAMALLTVVALNQMYIYVKGRTFFGSFPLFHDPRVTDGFISNTLEQLRRLREVAIARRDEPQAEQVFRTFLALVQTYYKIEYPGHGSSKFHASLAAAYLEHAVEAAVRAGLTDTTMAGLSSLREAAQVFLAGGRPTEMTGLAKTVGMIGTLGAVKEDYRPVTLSAVEQLTEMTLTLLRTRSRDIRFAAGEIRQAIHLIARVLLEVPDTPLKSVHSNFLAPYFSSTSFTSLRAQLTALVNALLEAGPDNDAAETIAHNMSEWADNLGRDLKELLLAAVEKQSHFTFDLIHWITGVSEFLVCVARAPSTSDYEREKLKDEAETLFLVLSWIPRDSETSRWLEAYSFTETVFDFALMSKCRNFEAGYDRAWSLLLKWATEAGREQTGWGTLEHALTALVALSLAGNENRGDALKDQLAAALEQPDSPSKHVRDSAARNLRAKAEALRPRQFEMRSVARVLARNDREATRELLREVANILSPDSPSQSDQPLR